MDELVASFIQSVVPATNTPQQHAAPAKASSSSNVISGEYMAYNDKGEAMHAGKTSLASLDIKVGTVVERKADKTALATVVESQYKVGYINDDGSVGLHRLDFRGELDTSTSTSVSYDCITSEYRIPKFQIELYAGYPDNEISGSDSWTGALQHAAAMFGLQQLSHEIGSDTSTLILQHRPVQRVRAGSAYAIGVLNIVPLTTKLGTPKTDEPSPIVIVIDVDGTPSFALSHVPSETCISAFFCLRKSSDKAACNLELKSKTTRIIAPLDGAPAEVNIIIPVAVNTVPIEIGAELVLYYEQHKRLAKATAGVVVGSQRKKPRQ